VTPDDDSAGSAAEYIAPASFLAIVSYPLRNHEPIDNDQREEL